MRLYRRTDYVVAGSLHVMIGRRSSGMDRMLARMGGRTGVLITAANPRSRAMPDGWNHRMTARLEARLARFATCPAEGRLGSWREAGLMACGDPRQLAAIGRVFRQNAVVLMRRGQAARLVWLV